MYLSFPPSLALSSSLILFPSRSLLLSSPLHLWSFENCARPIGEVTVRLWLSREFSRFLRAFPQSVASRDSFSRTYIYIYPMYSACASLPRRYRQALPERLVLPFPLPLAHLPSRKRRRDLTLCGFRCFPCFPPRHVN